MLDGPLNQFLEKGIAAVAAVWAYLGGCQDTYGLKTLQGLDGPSTSFNALGLEFALAFPA